MRARSVLFLALSVALLAPSLPSLAGGPNTLEARPPHSTPAGPMLPSSPAFGHFELIPRVHTCEGANVSPPLQVEGIPAGAASLLLIMGDPDAPSSLAPAINVTHWLVWDMPIGAGGVVTFAQGSRPAGSTQNANYAGPCPPIPMDAHRYHFEFHALDTTLGLATGTNRATLEDAMDGHILETATLIGLYDRSIPGVE